MPVKSARSNSVIFRQICELIPAHLVPKVAREYNIRSRSISAWSHVVTMVHAQFIHAQSLNDVCDSLNVNSSAMYTIRGARPPSRNGLSHANKKRDSMMAQVLFWRLLDHLQNMGGGFGNSGFGRYPRRFKVPVFVMDSTTIKLVANCIDWAKHRRRKAAAKLHAMIDLRNFLPAIAIVDSAKGHDNTKAHELCANLKSGEIVIFDMAYIDYKHLALLNERGVFWVSRVKESMKFRCVKKLPVPAGGNILRDDIVLIRNRLKRDEYPERMRRVKAVVEVDGKEVEMEFFTNNLEWAASSICELYKARWNIEVFFKQIKQTLKLSGFLGHSRRAIEWQIWTALIMYLLLRFLHTLSGWYHSFSRLYTCLRSVLWQKRDLLSYLKSYGTAQGSIRVLRMSKQLLLPGFTETL